MLEERPVPTPGVGEVLVRVHAAGVNPVDWKIREGRLQAYFPLDLPAGVGTDVAGVVASLGVGVRDLAIGQAVAGRASMTRLGAYAEYAVVDASALALIPAGLDPVVAAGLPLPALAAFSALDAMGVGAGTRVLIHGGAGAVGSFAVQLARQRGAHVTTTVGTADRGYAEELGAERVIDYTSERFEEVVTAQDAVLDGVGGETLLRSFATLKPGGILASLVVPPPEDAAKAAGVRAVFVSTGGTAEQLAAVLGDVASGRLRVRTRTMPLAEARRAHEEGAAGGGRGKIVLTMA